MILYCTKYKETLGYRDYLNCPSQKYSNQNSKVVQSNTDDIMKGSYSSYYNEIYYSVLSPHSQ